MKASAPSGSVSLTDIYGLLISSRLFVPSELDSLEAGFLSLYKFRRFVDQGALPLPIFTAIQHGLLEAMLLVSLAQCYHRNTSSGGSTVETDSRTTRLLGGYKPLRNLEEGRRTDPS